MCKRTLREWEQVTGISQEQQVEFAERCWVARTKANEERERAESERVHIEAEEERVRLQTLDAQMREDASIVCAFVPIPQDLKTPEYVRFLGTSGIPPAVVFRLQSDTTYTDADCELIQQKLSEFQPENIYISGLEAWKQLGLGTRSGWQQRKGFGECEGWEGPKVFVGPSWSTKIDSQEPRWKLFAESVKVHERSVKAESASLSPLQVQMHGERPRGGHRASMSKGRSRVAKATRKTAGRQMRGPTNSRPSAALARAKASPE